MDLYYLRYLEEVWPECWDDVDKQLWYCLRCNMTMGAQEDQRCPRCEGEIFPPEEDEEE
jgi:hypothetical protein